MDTLPFTVKNMIPPGRQRPIGPFAAVAMLISIDDGKQATLLVTKRSEFVGSHKGQISFAGGKAEIGDETSLDTAFRETEEELGLSRERLSVLGRLPEVDSIHGFRVIPYVFVTRNLTPDSMRIDQREVAAVYHIPLGELRADKAREFKFMAFGRSRASVYFETSVVRIWGLTAQIIYQAGLELR